MAMYSTPNRAVTKLSRNKDIFVLTDIHSTLNTHSINGEMVLGFFNFYTDYESASHACKKAFDGGMGRVKLTTIHPDDDIIYTGGANA